MERLYDEVPSLDLADFTKGNKDKKLKFVNDLGEAYHNIGFVAIKNHGLSDSLCEELYEAVKDFFLLSEEVKKEYEIEGIGGQRGYIGRGKEHAKGRKVGDLKEFYHVGQPAIEGEDLGYPKNVWPEEIANFKSVSVRVYQTLENTGKQILKALALYIGLHEDYFDDKVSIGNSILRAIHYFPIDNPEEIPEDAVRAAEHGDINLITLLMGASADGLQVLRRDGKWISITALPEQIVVNVGDMLARLTNNYLKSTIHRVVNPPKDQMGTSRFSIPFFMHPRADMDLSCLPECVDNDHEKQFEDMTAGQFLEQRLKEIGLVK